MEAAVRRPLEDLLVDGEARRSDDRVAHQDVVRALRVPGAAEERADPAPGAEARFVLVGWRLEHDGAAAESGGEVHYSRRAEGEALVRRDGGVDRRGARRADGCVMPIHDVGDDPHGQ